MLEIYDTLRSARIPAACYAVGKMEANQQGSAFSVTALRVCRGRALSLPQMQPLFKLKRLHAEMQDQCTSELVCFLQEIKHVEVLSVFLSAMLLCDSLFGRGIYN